MGIADMVSWLMGQLAGVAIVLDSPVALAAVLLLLTTGAIGLCVPGLLMPISFSAGVLLDSWLAVPVVALGAVLGSLGLFLAARYGMAPAFERRLAGRMERFAPHLGRYGFGYVVLLRMIGTPHVLVTLASAASPLRPGRFALATLIGFLPSIALSAGAGTVF